ncbi:MAG: DCC1-like thiol-disulfide oxidoreductase family protein [Verrucomicrobiales bacterium]|nr:DCC1-like thiol-disulfide oxidoreductase family protein [Verrucomicrobiales bacterium]
MKTRGWIFYDATCAFCVRGRKRAGRLFESRGFEWLPLQTPGAAARLGVSKLALQVRMHLLTADGRVLHNADALGALCRSIWWLWPLGFLLLVPGFREIGRFAYDWFARNRYCVGSACHVDPKERGSVEFTDWVAVALLPTLVGFACRHEPPWLLMWGLAFGFGFALKWLMWRDAISHGAFPSAKRALIWFMLWPGLDGRTFFAENERIKRPEAREWLLATAMTASGATLIWGVTPPLLPGRAAAAAWVGMIGIVLLLHFGVVRLVSILCRHFGVNAQPIMKSPFCAISLTAFWSARWNTAFSIPARRLVLLPLAPRIGLSTAVFSVFLISGLIHDVVISLPAQGGFGLPTLYFVVQGAGVAVERSRFGRAWVLDNGLKGRLFVLLFTVGPLYWLFHPAFVHQVMLPFLNVLNAQ